MSNKKILLVEDELSLAMVVSDNLQSAGYRVTHARNGEEGLRTFFIIEPDLVILDVMMPKADGYTVAQSIRETDRSTPILFLTAKVQTKDVIRGFESGGNDYIRKPFSIEELLIRIKVMLNENRLLEKPKPKGKDTFQLGDYEFDSRKSELFFSGTRKKLTYRESDLLKLFCQNQDETLNKKTLLLKVWQDDSFINSRSLDVFVSRLRKYLKQDPRVQIINIRGVGYKLMIHS
ncbi:MAG: response regulator transcription factor [Roseivirga sp.]